MSFLAALRFLTIIPLPLRREVSLKELGRSLGYFPLIGLVIGLLLAGLNWLLSLVLPSGVVSVLLIVFLVVISGGLHLDGFVDTCDGLARHRTVEERLGAMRDSRAGAFGIIGVVLLLLLKYICLDSIPEVSKMSSLIFMPVVGRWAMVYAIFAHPYARPSGLGKVFKQEASLKHFVLATLVMLIVALLLPPLFSWLNLAIIVFVFAVTVAISTYLKHQFSGLTGDTYGAINEVAEVGVLILASLFSFLGLT